MLSSADTTMETPRHESSRERLRQLLEASSAAGLAHATSAVSRSARFFWIVMLVVGTTGLVTHLFFVFQHFFRRPILIELNQKTDSFEWPDITLCNPMNPLSIYHDASLTLEWQAQVNKAVRIRPYVKRSLHYTFDHMYKTMALSSLNLSRFHVGNSRTLVYMWGVQVEEETISKVGGLYDQNRMRLTRQKHFKTSLIGLPHPVGCHTLRIHDNARLKRLMDSGANIKSVTLYVRLDYMSYTLFDGSYSLRGAHLYIMPHNALFSSRSFYIISPGSSTTVSIAMQRHKRMGSRGFCRSEHFCSEMYSADMRSTQSFIGDYADCKLHLSQEFFRRHCKCYNPWLPIYKSDQVPPRLCLNMTLYNETQILSNIDCLKRVYREFSYKRKNFFKEELKLKCNKFRKPLCDEVVYDQHLQIHTWSPDTNQNLRNAWHNVYRQQFNRSINADSASRVFFRNFASIKISQSHSDVELRVERLQYPMSHLFADIGGSLGLWVGLSAVSVFEIFELSCLGLKYLVRRWYSHFFRKRSN